MALVALLSAELAREYTNLSTLLQKHVVVREVPRTNATPADITIPKLSMAITVARISDNVKGGREVVRWTEQLIDEVVQRWQTTQIKYQHTVLVVHLGNDAQYIRPSMITFRAIQSRMLVCGGCAPRLHVYHDEQELAQIVLRVIQTAMPESNETFAQEVQHVLPYAGTHNLCSNPEKFLHLIGECTKNMGGSQTPEHDVFLLHESASSFRNLAELSLDRTQLNRAMSCAVDVTTAEKFAEFWTHNHPR